LRRGPSFREEDRFFSHYFLQCSNLINILFQASLIKKNVLENMTHNTLMFTKGASTHVSLIRHPTSDAMLMCLPVENPHVA